MPRLARPIPRDRTRSRSPAVQAVSTGYHRFIAFAAVNLPTNFPENPLKDIGLILDFPWLKPQNEDADGHPNKRRLLTVTEFFRYTDDQDAEFFKMLDQDEDGKVTVDDLKEVLRRNNLSQDYAHQFISRARGARWWANSITFEEFKSMIDDSESKMLRAFCNLDVDNNGSLDMAKIKASLAKLDLPASDDNARAMLRALGKAEDASIAYGEFRRFAVLMPRDKLMSDREPNLAWFESATCLPIGGNIEQGVSTAKVLIRAALAGGLSSGLSTLCMHPLDTLKTRVQSIPGASIASVAREVPQMGRRALYRGIIPAGTGAFSSHGIRTCAYEAALIAMSSVGIPFLQAQPAASFLGTFVGTIVRIPCEVLKQQLQRGNHTNVKVALAEIAKLDGTRGFFRGAGALMAREVPFYVAGMVLYEQYKRLFNGEYLGSSVRQLSNPETIAIGALAGASASFLTTPADVVKSRLMTAAAGSSTSTATIIVELISKEGVWALFKGAVPRAIWIAPLGAMNFAGYELAKRAMGVQSSGVEVSEKKVEKKVDARAGAATAAAPEAKPAAADARPKDLAARDGVAAAAPADQAAAPAQKPAAAAQPSGAGAAAAVTPRQAAGEGGAAAGSAAAAAAAAAPPQETAATAASDAQGAEAAAAATPSTPPDAEGPADGGQPLARITWPWSQHAQPPDTPHSMHVVGRAAESACPESAGGAMPQAEGGYCAVCGRSGGVLADARVEQAGVAAGVDAVGPLEGPALGLSQVRSWLLAWPGRW